MRNKLLLIFGLIGLLSAPRAAAADPAMRAANVTGESGDVATLEVKLTNTSPLRDFQMFLRLPQGISIEKDANENFIIDVNKAVAPYHTGIANYDEGLYKIVVASPQDSPVLCDGATLVSIPLTLDVPVGTYTFRFNTVYASQDLDGMVTNVPFPDFGGTITVETPVVVDAYQFYNKTVHAEAGTAEIVLPIRYNNPAAVKAFLFDMELPEGFTPIYNTEADDYLEPGDRIPSRFDVYSELSGSTLAVDGATTRNSSIAAGDDALLTLRLSVSAPAGTYQVVYANQSATLADGSEVTAPDFTALIVIEGESAGVNAIYYTDEEFSASLPANSVAKLADGTLSARRVEITDANPIDIPEGFTAQAVSYRRDFVYTVWQPLYVPYDMACEDWAGKGDVAQLTGVATDANGAAVLRWATVTEGTLKPNRPYIFKPAEAGECVFEGTDRTFAPTADADVIRIAEGGTEYVLTGVYQQKSDMRTSGAYGMAPDGSFKHVTSDAVVLKPFRIFLMVEGGSMQHAPVRNMVDGGETTAITGIEAVAAGTHEIYDLTGRRSSARTSGIYIVDGEKTLINKQ